MNKSVARRTTSQSLSTRPASDDIDTLRDQLVRKCRELEEKNKQVEELGNKLAKIDAMRENPSNDR